MRILRPPNTFRVLLPALLLISVFICGLFFRWWALLIAIPLAILIHWTISAFLGLRYSNRSINRYWKMLKEGYSKDEALLEFSKMAHPKLDEQTHKEIISKFNDIEMLTFFLDSLPSNTESNECAKEIKDRSSIFYFREGKYRQPVVKKKMEKLMNFAVTQDALGENILLYLKNTNPWSDLKDATNARLSELLQGDFTALKHFVEISKNYRLVTGNFLELEKIYSKIDELLCYFSITLGRLGAQLMMDYTKRNVEAAFRDSIRSYELSIKLDPLQIPSYGSLALIWGDGMGKRAKGNVYCELGIRAYGLLSGLDANNLTYYHKALLSDQMTIEQLYELRRRFSNNVEREL